jgi:rSAM/selenodomain-associated transferase 1
MKSSEARADSCRVAVFAKAPVAGEVKTRLVPLIGAEGAARLHAALVRHALADALRAGLGPVELWCAPDDRDPFFRQCERELGVRLRVQSGRDLGARMGDALGDALAQGQAMVLIGSDCPALGPSALRDAARALDTHDAVFTPAEDGGYVLVGLARPVPRLFDDIAWGTDAVMGETRLRLAAAGARWQEMPASWDVDRPEDYARLRREGLLEAIAT